MQCPIRKLLSHSRANMADVNYWLTRQLFQPSPFPGEPSSGSQCWFCASSNSIYIGEQPENNHTPQHRLLCAMHPSVSFRLSGFATWEDSLSIGNHHPPRRVMDHCRLFSLMRPIFKRDKRGTENKQVGKLEHTCLHIGGCPAKRDIPGSTCVVFVFIRAAFPCAAGIGRKLALSTASSKSKQ